MSCTVTSTIEIYTLSLHDALPISLQLSAVEFWRRAIDILEFSDLMQGFSKAVAFGLILSTVGCYKGLTVRGGTQGDRKSTRLNSSHTVISYAVFCLKKKKQTRD